MACIHSLKPNLYISTLESFPILPKIRKVIYLMAKLTNNQCDVEKWPKMEILIKQLQDNLQQFQQKLEQLNESQPDKHLSTSIIDSYIKYQQRNKTKLENEHKIQEIKDWIHILKDLEQTLNLLSTYTNNPILLQLFFNKPIDHKNIIHQAHNWNSAYELIINNEEECPTSPSCVVNLTINPAINPITLLKKLGVCDHQVRKWINSQITLRDNLSRMNAFRTHQGGNVLIGLTTTSAYDSADSSSPPSPSSSASSSSSALVSSSSSSFSSSFSSYSSFNSIEVNILNLVEFFRTFNDQISKVISPLWILPQSNIDIFLSLALKTSKLSQTPNISLLHRCFQVLMFPLYAFIDFIHPRFNHVKKNATVSIQSNQKSAESSTITYNNAIIQTCCNYLSVLFESELMDSKENDSKDEKDILESMTRQLSNSLSMVDLQNLPKTTNDMEILVQKLLLLVIIQLERSLYNYLLTHQMSDTTMEKEEVFLIKRMIHNWQVLTRHRKLSYNNFKLIEEIHCPLKMTGDDYTIKYVGIAYRHSFYKQKISWINSSGLRQNERIGTDFKLILQHQQIKPKGEKKRKNGKKRKLIELKSKSKNQLKNQYICEFNHPQKLDEEIWDSISMNMLSEIQPLIASQISGLNILVHWLLQQGRRTLFSEHQLLATIKDIRENKNRTLQWNSDIFFTKIKNGHGHMQFNQAYNSWIPILDEHSSCVDSNDVTVSNSSVASSKTSNKLYSLPIQYFVVKRYHSS